jgi:hypothetical protein
VIRKPTASTPIASDWGPVSQGYLDRRIEARRDWPAFWADHFGDMAVLWMHNTGATTPGLLNQVYEQARLAGHFGLIALESRIDV